MFLTILRARARIVTLIAEDNPESTSKRPGAQKFPAPSGALLLSKRSEVASSCWRATERPLYEKVETTPK
jgi:hypothetical protein